MSLFLTIELCNRIEPLERIKITIYCFKIALYTCCNTWYFKVDESRNEKEILFIYIYQLIISLIIKREKHIYIRMRRFQSRSLFLSLSLSLSLLNNFKTIPIEPIKTNSSKPLSLNQDHLVLLLFIHFHPLFFGIQMEKQLLIWKK